MKFKESMPHERHNPGEDSLTLDSDLAELERLRDFIEAFCERNALSEQIRDHLAIALEELVVNAAVHGNCDPRAGAIRIDLDLRWDRLQVVFSDTGMPFNPLAVPPPDLAEDLGRRPIGGLGIYFVRCLMPEIRYERRDGRNYLFMTRSLEPKENPARRQGGADADGHGNCPH
jgi:anti-sigma regulatory factor (Ser/Thr protein kinase)